jgi:hypothetical protein
MEIVKYSFPLFELIPGYEQRANGFSGQSSVFLDDQILQCERLERMHQKYPRFSYLYYDRPSNT